MILSICVYSLLALFLWLLAEDQISTRYCKINRYHTSFWTWQNIAAILLFAIIYGVRYNVGVDNLVYIRFYRALEQGQILRDNLEVGYASVQKLFVNLGFHYSAFIGFWGLLQIGLIYYAFRRKKYLLPFIALFIVLGPTWLRWANIMRQAVVECAFLFLIEFIVGKKIWKYIVGVSLCCIIHKSALILFPFYFIFQKPIYPRTWWTGVFCVVLCTIIGSSPTWIHSINFIKPVLSFLEYESYTLNFEEIMQNQDNYRAWGPSRAGLWVLYTLSIGIYPLLHEKYKFGATFNIYFECFFFGTCMYELFANTSQIFIRPISLFQSFSVAVVPICLYYLWKTRRKFLFYVMAILAFFNTYWWTVKAYLANGTGEQSPEVYKFFFLQ